MYGLTTAPTREVASISANWLQKGKGISRLDVELSIKTQSTKTSHCGTNRVRFRLMRTINTRLVVSLKMFLITSRFARRGFIFLLHFGCCLIQRQLEDWNVKFDREMSYGEVDGEGMEDGTRIRGRKWKIVNK